MTRKFYRIAVVTLSLTVGLALSQSAALADQLTLTGTPTNYTMGGEYTDPYQFTVNPGGSTMLLSCDDLNTSIYLGETWTANRISLADAATQGKFASQGAGVVNPADSNASTYTIQEKYDAVGWLAEQLLQMLNVTPLSDPSRATLAGQYTFAIWQIFASNALSKLGSADQTAVENDMIHAFAAAPTADLSGVFLYTPDPLSAAQEFIGVPEASTPAFLAFYFLALPGVLFLLRRRYLRE
jgi:hypothetical protein